MFLKDEDFQADLLKHKVYTAWQFILYTRKNISITQYCADTLIRIISKMENKTVSWEQDISSDFVDVIMPDGSRAHKLSVTSENAPVYELRVAGEKVNPWFLFDKLIRDFYQYTMNSLDSISQVANAGLLANNAKKVDAVDFQKMASCFKQQTYSMAFPKTSSWFNRIDSSDEYKYIEAINNRTKHTADIANKLSMGILGSSSTAQIGPFFRKEKQHEKKELADQLQATLDFLRVAWEDFLNAFYDEYILDMYIEGRQHKISGVYQQKLTNEPDQDLSYAFVEASDFTALPKEIHVLLINDKDVINAHICPFNSILVRKDDGHEVLGRYIAETVVGDDCLLQYRKYIKDESTPGSVCMYYEMKEGVKFYRCNPYFDITTVSDDDDFLKKASLPI